MHPKLGKVAALIAAAGSGTRLARGPKALVEVAGMTLLERALKTFEGYVDDIIVAVSPEMQRQTLTLVAKKAHVVLGGASRQETVYAMLQATDAAYVLIHDAARPFLSPTILKNALTALETHDAITVAKPVADTLIDVQRGSQLDRSVLRAVQTPQGFRRDLIIQAHQAARVRGEDATDDAGLVRQLGVDVALVEGDAWLMKVTTPADYEIACVLGGAWDAQMQHYK